MQRRTSKEAFARVKASGLVTGVCWKIYWCLYHYGPHTASEVASMLPEYQIDSVRPRFAELKALGVVRAVRERVCSVSKMSVTEWDVTTHAPTDADRPVKARRFWLVIFTKDEVTVYHSEADASQHATDPDLVEIVPVRESIKRKLRL